MIMSFVSKLESFFVMPGFKAHVKRFLQGCACVVVA